MWLAALTVAILTCYPHVYYRVITGQRISAIRIYPLLARICCYTLEFCVFHLLLLILVIVEYFYVKLYNTIILYTHDTDNLEVNIWRQETVIDGSS